MHAPIRATLIFMMAVLLALSSGIAGQRAAANGSEGDVKIHDGAVEPDPPSSSTKTKVCTFHVHGTSFVAQQDITWWIDQKPPTGTATVIPAEHATTDANGNFASSVRTLPTGSYGLSWQLGTGTVKSKNFSVDCGDQTAWVVAEKFEDIDGDGILDAEDPKLEGWTFTVKDGSGATVGTLTTGADGHDVMSVPPGTYTICENTPLPAGWVNTRPGGGEYCETGTIAAKGTAWKQFGNQRSEIPDGAIFVNVYDDRNDNGHNDDEPNGGADWVYTVKDSDGGTVGTITSDASGSGGMDLPAGTYSVVQTPRSGWHNTEPGGEATIADVTVTSGETTYVTFGNAQTQTNGTLRVFKYQDTNGDHEYESDSEPGLSGWHFTVTPLVTDLQAQSLDLVTGTDPLGQGTLSIRAGSYEVCEVTQDGWQNTDPGDGLCKSITVRGGQQSNILYFGNQATTAGLTICKYNDADADGQRDEGETLLAGWQFTIAPAEVDSVAAVSVAGITTAVTGANGCVTTTLPLGWYRVTETAQAYWTNTEPGGGTTTTYVGGLTLSEEDGAILYFGNHYSYTPPPGPIPGYLQINTFNDYDRDGVRDAGEPSLGSVTFDVKYGGTTQLHSATNASGGAHVTLLAGVYSVVETPPTGWTPTTVTTQPATIVEGGTTVLDFGLVQAILPPTTATQLTITKYLDANANGVRDAGEPALAGFSFFVKSTDGAVGQTITTDASGVASIANLPLGGYSVTEVAKAGYTNTDPGGNATKYFALATGSTTAALSFGNAETKLPSTSTDPGMTGAGLSLVLLGGIALMYLMARRATRTS